MWERESRVEKAGGHGERSSAVATLEHEKPKDEKQDVS